MSLSFVADNVRVAARFLILLALFWLPKEKRRQLERWLRGREEFKKLQRSDWVLMSWGKSGRTWLRVMLSRAYTLKSGLDASQFLDFDNLKDKDSELPAVFFTHNNYLRDYLGSDQTKTHFQGKKVVLLVRDPRDVAVSQFFQWQFRMKPHKKYLNDYPPHQSDISSFDFVLNENVGLPQIIEYFNGWAKVMPQIDNMLLVRYEDMRTDPVKVLTEILTFTQSNISAQQICEAVEFGAYDNMKKMEKEGFFKGGGSRVKAADNENPHSFKVRKAKVGGYRDYFTDEQCAQLDRMVEDVDPIYGYGVTKA